ncbi:hypothetical protein DPMN_190733 [Dreissena polymorpha]|uniref:Uncharacterized protein n=1 Tax=Dreissena polymorpha TaxID=45954 RepID=A0A9D3XYA1_DREPO|nr:hypothetical protein DPMN_190733 [Dreissena polymorpha]
MVSVLEVDLDVGRLSRVQEAQPCDRGPGVESLLQRLPVTKWRRLQLGWGEIVNTYLC